MSITKEELVKGAFYLVNARNFGVAVWTGITFRGGAIALADFDFIEEQHYEDGIPFGTCTPIKRIGPMVARGGLNDRDALAAMLAMEELNFDKG